MAENEDEKYRIPDKLWGQIKPMLPPEFAVSSDCCSEMDDRRVMEAILHVLRTGCEWKAIPQSLGVPDKVQRHFQEWRRYGVFQRMWLAGILTYDELRKLIWHDRKGDILNDE